MTREALARRFRCACGAVLPYEPPVVTESFVGWSCARCARRVPSVDGRPVLPTAQERFWAQVDKTPSCWLWTGRRVKGYGEFRHDGRPRYAHRLAYEMVVGPIPEGLELDHLCCVRACVNPAHLEPVTTAENVRRQTARMDYSKRHHRNGNSGKTHCIHGHPFDEANTIWEGQNRHCRACMRARRRRRDALRPRPGVPKGEKVRTAKLTADDVRAIRARHAAGESAVSIAAAYGIHRSNIAYIVTRQTWKHID